MSILVDENTTFIVQGITGREAVNLTRECLDYGSRVVGGVTPGRKGRDVHGEPVYLAPSAWRRAGLRPATDCERRCRLRRGPSC